MTEAAFAYLVGLYEDSVLIARVSKINLPRAQQTLLNKAGPNGELLETYGCGSREEMLSAFAGELTAEDFDEADAAYRISPKNQLLRDRVSG